MTVLSGLCAGLSNSKSYNYIYHLVLSSQLPYEVNTAELHCTIITNW